MNIKACSILFICLALSACWRGSTPEVSQRSDSSIIDEVKELFNEQRYKDLCQNHSDSVYQRPVNLGTNDYPCCLIECAGRGDKSCENQVIKVIRSCLYSSNLFDCYLCYEHDYNLFKSKLIIEAVFDMASDSPNLFKCVDGPHGESGCYGSFFIVSDLHSALKELSKNPIKWPEEMIEVPFDVWSEENCRCNRSKYTFLLVKHLYETGQVELYDYYYQAQN